MKNSTNIFRSLNNRNFLFMWLSLLFSMAGFQIQMTVRGILVYDITNNAFITGAVSAGFAPSLLLFSMFGGVLGEKVDKKRLIQFAQGMNMLASILIGLLIYFDLLHWSHLLLVSISQGAMFAIQVPARQSLIPELVGKDLVTNAIGLNAMIMGITTMIAPAIGGYTYEFFGPLNSYLIVSFTMIIGVFMVGFVPSFPPKLISKNKSTFQEIINGFTYLKTNKVIRLIWIHAVVLALCTGPFRMLIPVFAKDVYLSSPGEVGNLMAAGGIGGILSSLLIASLGPRSKRGLILILIGIVTGIGLLMASTLTFFIVGVVAMIIVGFSETGRWSLGQALMMEHAGEEYRARVISLLMMTWGLMPISMLPMGWAFGYFGPEITTFVTAIITLLFAITSIYWAKSLSKL
ncbi:MAG: MFS transporter [Chloroflexota bacterium]|nr:MFS transporter [Chloroflexota bacterium]MED5237567.1 MFS transporter [Chloroflexota bacterium]MED5254838.1 MFS transporter [Chloroflexota bacterium]